MVSTDILVVATVSNWGLTELWLHCPDVWDKAVPFFLDQILHNKNGRDRKRRWGDYMNRHLDGKDVQSSGAWMQHLQDKYKKLDAIVGIEPTGHYWFDLGAYLEDEGILLVMVNPYAVKSRPRNWMITAKARMTGRIRR